MCGIVGYVGHQQALRRVLEGLRRLEYRGYDSAGVAVLDGAGGLACEKRAGRIENLDKALAADHPGGLPAPPASGTPAGRRTAPPTDRNAHPHLDAARRGRGHPQRDHRELRAAAGRAGGGGRRAAQRDRHRGGRAPARRPRCPPPAVTWPRRCGAVCRRLRRRLHPGRAAPRPARPAGRRPPQLAAGGRRRRRARRSWPATSPRSSRTPGRRSSSARTRSSRSPRGRLHGDRLRRRAGRGRRRSAVDWDLAAAEKGGYPYFMLKEIEEQPAAVADTLLGRLVDGPDRAGRAAAGQPGAARRRQGLRHRLRHRVPRRPDREVRDRALDPGAGRGRDGLGVPLPGPGAGPGHAGGGDLAVRRDGRHAGGRPARPGAEGAGAGDLQHQRRADPARVRRGALHPGRPRDRRRRDQDLPDPDRRRPPGRARRWPRRGAPSTATRWPGSSRRWRRCRR